MTMNPHLAMSDEDFLNQPLPDTAGASSEEPKTETTPAQAEENVEIPAADPVVEEAPADPNEQTEAEKAAAAEGEDEGTEGKEGDKSAEKPEGDKAKEGEKTAEPAPTDPKPEVKADPAGSSEATAMPDAEGLAAFYTTVMKPFTANGKDIQLKSPEEAIQLMQMGANYTRKMQEIAPHRKLITMLSNNKLDEDKLSFLIDLDKGDPEAIKRLIKDKGIDPLDIDTNTEPAYREGSHKVSDDEQKFNTHMEELISIPEGKETLLEIDKNWDQSSKDMLWQHPEVMSVIHAQRKSGVYAKIAGEVDRLRVLGKVAPDTPFLEAYRIAGDTLLEAGALNDKPQDANPAKETPAAPPAKEPVATRAAPAKPDAAASKVDAAAPTRTAPGKATEFVNFLSMSDEEFAKHSAFAGRV